MPTIGECLLEERKRLGLNQDQMAGVGCVAKRTYCNYEADDRVPDAAFLAALVKAGADVNYILTGQRDTHALLDDERLMLERYRACPPTLRDAALRVLLGGEASTKKQTQVFKGDVDLYIQAETLDQRGISFFAEKK